MKQAAVRAQQLKDDYLRLVDLDTEAFTKVIDAHRLAKATEEQKNERDAALKAATEEATRIPLEVLEKSVELLKLAKKAAQKGNRNSLSDAGVAALTARAAAEGAFYNVCINLPGIRDAEVRSGIQRQASLLKKRACRLAEALRVFMEKELNKI
jgi:glutamate formiminotransferase/formiminotetrahydrofolate cyclodeaminase